jgi:hypothetical protein
MAVRRMQKRPRSRPEHGRSCIWAPAFAGETELDYRAKLTPPSTVTAPPIT